MEINKQGALPDSSFLASPTLKSVHPSEKEALRKLAADRSQASSRLHEKPEILPTPKQVEKMIKDLFLGNLAAAGIGEIKKHATENPELFKRAISRMIEKNNGSEMAWEQAIEIADALSLPKSSRSSSQASFADELKMEINTQRFIRDLTWHVKNAGFAEEGFSIADLNFREFSLPLDQSVTRNALMKVISPDGPFGSFGLDLALKFTADAGLESLHAKFNSYKDALADLNPVGGKIDYRTGTDNYAQNDIRHIISSKISARNPAYNTLIQLFMMPNSLLPDDLSKRAFLKEAGISYSQFVKELPENLSNYSLHNSKPMQNLVANMIPLIQKHFQQHNLAGELPNLLGQLAAGGTGRLALTLPENF